MDKDDVRSRRWWRLYVEYYRCPRDCRHTVSYSVARQHIDRPPTEQAERAEDRLRSIQEPRSRNVYHGPFVLERRAIQLSWPSYQV